MTNKNKNIIREGPSFTHFLSLPFIRQEYRQHISGIQQMFRSILHSHPEFKNIQILRQHSHKLCHVTLCKLILRRSQAKQKVTSILSQFEGQLQKTLSEMPISLQRINYFTRFNKNMKMKEVTVVYIQLEEAVVYTINKLVDRLMRRLLSEEVVIASELKDMNIFYDHNSNLYKPETLHLSLFRANNIIQNQTFLNLFSIINSNFKKTQFQCDTVQVSVMGEFTQSQYYRSMHTIPVNPKCQSIKQ